MIFTDLYSEIYDQIHENKDYELEASQISNVILEMGLSKNSPVLDFGCGTGKHLSYLDKLGHKVAGYDINSYMLSKAKVRNKRLNFYSEFGEIPKIFKCSYSLFDVLSYQIYDDDLNHFLNQISKVVDNPGWILLDGWHLPGLLNSPPISNSRNFTHNDKSLTREVSVHTIEDFKITNLNIIIKEVGKNKLILEETHRLRAFTSFEIIKLIQKFGGVEITFLDGSNYLKPLTDTSWRFAVYFKLT